MADILEPPINKKFLESVLKCHFRTNLKVSNLALSDAASIGENFLSTLFRVVINYELENGKEMPSLSLVIKCCPKNNDSMNAVKLLRCFENEIGFYGTVLPAINKLRYQEKISAKSVHASLVPNPVLMFEDLTTLKYIMHPREVGLDLDHCLMVAEKFAYLHAASFAIYQNDPTILTVYENGLFSKNNHSVTALSVGFNSLVESCKHWTNLNCYYTKLKSMKDNFLEDLFQIMKPTGNFNVLNHGDCWINNIMFNYDQNGKVQNAVLVDFQILFFSSPSVDLHIFWATSPSLEVQEHHFNTFLGHYYNLLLRNLSKFDVNVNIPSREELHEDFKKRALCGLAAAVILLPLIKASKREDADFTNFLKNGSENGFRYHCFNNKNYNQHISYLLQYYSSLGMFS
ncbi:hypothetical protein RI129_001103 [Pyrocoelia pectoralis]|uniref:CHK kinase-like domain-containing protein n=1 Tax=Pyrocoelia pectoralis TaxID=417401 RepID=A0AAN7VX43_9COLE